MLWPSAPTVRRDVLRHLFLGAGMVGTLGACRITRAGIADGTMASRTDGAVPEVSPEGQRLNVALNMEYVGAAFFGVACGGGSIPGDLTTGLGSAGTMIGGRAADFADPDLANYASEVAADKLGHVRALRDRLGAEAAAMPTIDFSVTPLAAFSVAAQAAGIVADHVAFDPFSSDENFLLAAFVLEDAVAAAYRALSAEIAAEDDRAVIGESLTDAIYHGGLIRTLLEAKAAADPALTASFTAIRATMAGLDRQDGAGRSDDLIDAAGRTIPFERDRRQALSAIRLNFVAQGSGGLLPNGANGLGRAV